MFLGGKIFLTVQKSRKCAYFYKKCRKTSLIVEFIKKFLLKLHLQSSLGRGKSWFQWKNIFESKLEKNISSQNWKKIFQVQLGKYFRMPSPRHVLTREAQADCG